MDQSTYILSQMCKAAKKVAHKWTRNKCEANRTCAGIRWSNLSAALNISCSWPVVSWNVAGVINYH